MQSNPYLFFTGECETAFKFYEQCFGGKILEKMTITEMIAKGETDEFICALFSRD
ncbi:MAG: hypothetical protein JOZ78_17975 [Chroococcidiopsidaceae cyanobacterium CP_BM_ER_R8_30]|nr:hypothetical protein [Chroococcidiopsidaceae cyanobacterium CP_BM_ER_R8_30]